MSMIDLGEDDGYISVKFGQIEANLDVFDVNDKINAERLKAGEDMSAWRAGIIEILRGYGFPTVTGKVAYRFVEAVNAVMLSWQKKTTATPSSPDSTASTPPA